MRLIISFSFCSMSFLDSKSNIDSEPYFSPKLKALVMLSRARIFRLESFMSEVTSL